MRGFLTSMCAGALFSCAADLRDDFPFDGALPSGVYAEFDEPPSANALEGAEVRVNASNKEAWVYVDLDGRRDLPALEALSTHAWDLAFQRVKIITNSGVSGNGTVGTAVLPGTDFEAFAQAPADGYLTDLPDSNSDSDSDVNSPFLVEGGWYSYDIIRHRVNPSAIVYVVRSSEGAYFKLRIQSYYDAAGSSGRFSIRLASIAPPANEQ